MSAELIHQMYIAYYQRPADPGGHQFWLNRLNAEGGGATGWAAISADFISSAESDALYGTASSEAKLAQFYTAAFGRAGTSTEVTALLGDGTANLGVLAYNLVAGASGDDLLTVNQKVDYAEAFVATLDPAGLGIGPFQFYYQDPTLGRDLNVGVTKDSDVSSSSVLAQVQTSIPTSDPAAASPALPTSERTTELTSGPDVVALTGETTDQINAALGGSSPTLSRSDQIDGGSAQDVLKVAMDGNFLLGFNSSGFVKNVEIIDLAATAPSVAAKTFNFTGVTGVDQINVGAGNAEIVISEISDTDLTVNVSGQSSGAFDVGFASGTISGSGSSLTIGTSDIGSDGTNVSITANGITDLDVVSYGRGNYIDLGGGVNDLQTIAVSGVAPIYIDGIPTTVSAFTAASASGPVTLGIDASSNGNTALTGDSAQITGGAGFDTIRLDTNGTFATDLTSIEAIKFDGSAATATVKATGMGSINTLTFSGVSGTAPVINGLGDQALTVNAILETAPSGGAVDISGQGALTVNIQANPTQAALASTSSNHFDFESSTNENVTINVGSYVSSSGTYTLDSKGEVKIDVAANSTFGSVVRASGAETITLAGSGNIAAVISGREATTISVNAGSGTLSVGSSAAQTFNLTTQSNVTINSSTSRLSGVQNMNVNIADNTADLTALGFQDMRVLTLQGAGSGSSVLMNDVSGSGNNMTLTMTGLAGGFSAANIHNVSGNLSIVATDMTGTIDIGRIDHGGSGVVQVQGGTLGNFSAGVVHSAGRFTLDASANTEGTASVAFGTFSASGAVNIALGSGSGDFSLGTVEAESTFDVDGTSFKGTMDVTTFTAGGATTFVMGTDGDFSAGTIGTAGAFKLVGESATSGEVSITTLSAGGGITVSMGTGSGDVALSAVTTGGGFVLNAPNFAGRLDTTTVTASGNVTVVTGSLGDFSAADIQTAGKLTVDGSKGVTGQITLTGASAANDMTVQMGAGTGAVAVVAGTTGGKFTLDASLFNGTMNVGTVTASGAVAVSVGPKGQFSANDIATQGKFDIDAGASTSGNIILNSVTAGGNLSIAMGTGTGGLTLTDGFAAGKISIDATKFGGTVNATTLSASGTVTVQTGTIGQFSASQVHTTADFQLDGTAASSGNVTLRTVSASGVTISMGTGTGSVSLVTNLDAGKNLIIDAAAYHGNVDLASVSVSGTSTIQVADGNFSAGETDAAGVFTFTKATSSTGNATFTSFSAGSNATISMGAGSGSLTLVSAQANAGLTINATTFTGTTTITGASAGAISINLAAGARGAFSAGVLASTSSITFTQSAGASGKITMTNVSASGAVSLALGNGDGSGDVAVSIVNTESTFSLTGGAQYSDVTFDTINAASGITVNMAGSGSFTASSLETGAALNFSKPIGSAETAVITNISAGSVAITMGAGSSHFSAVTIDAGGFTFDSTASTFEAVHTLDVISASGTVSISLGGNDGVAVSSLVVASAGASITKGSSGSSDVTFAVGITADGAITVTGGGSGTLSVSTIGTAGGFTFNGEAMGAGGASYFSANTIAATSGDVTFQFGSGNHGFVDVSAIDTVSAFTLVGASLNSADIAIVHLSATQGVSFSNMGGASGSAVIAAIDTDGVFTFNAGASNNLALNVETLSASAVSIVLGAQAASTHDSDISSTQVDTFTLDGTNFAGNFNMEDISASGITITMGQSASALTISAINAAETFSLTSNGGGPLSAEITNLSVNGTFTISSTEDSGGSLTIGSLNFSASGTVTGSGGSDDVAASATGVAAGQEVTFTFDMRDDDQADVLKYTHSTAGKEVVKILNFKTGSDSISAAIIGSGVLNATAIGTTTAAAILTDALGTTIEASNLTAASTAGGTMTAIFTNNSNSEVYFIGATAGNALNSTFDNGEVVFYFTNADTVLQSDLGGL